jgi:site-specific DNA-methyltransferase (adenine-specific)
MNIAQKIIEAHKLKFGSLPPLQQCSVSGSALFNADCMDILPLIPDKSVQLILADLPYGTTACKWDIILPLDKLWEQYERIIKDDGAIVLTSQQPFTSALIMSNTKLYKYNWHWNKVKPSSFFNAKNAPMKKIEDVAVFSKGNIANGSKNMMKYNPQGLIECGKIRPPKNDSVPSQSTIGKRPSRANAYKQEFTNYPTDLIEFSFEQKPIHPTQKPLEMMKYFIATYSDENDYVLDNTMGVGTTCLGAKELKRLFIGIEKEVKYYELAVARVFG